MFVNFDVWMFVAQTRKNSGTDLYETEAEASL